MPITWKVEIVKVSDNNESLEHSANFDANTITEAQEKADEVVSQHIPQLSGKIPDINWTLDQEKNRVVKVYYPLGIRPISRQARVGIEISLTTEWYVTIKPLNTSLQDIQ